MRRLALLGLLVALALPATASPANAEPVTARLLVSNPAPWVGEELDLTLEIRYRQHPGGRAAYTWPDFDRLLAADPAESRSRRQRTADGAILETLQRRILPLQPGVQRLAGGSLRFGDRVVPVTGCSLHVRPLPQPAPEGFAGLVGPCRLRLEAPGSGDREILLAVATPGRLAPPPRPHLAPGPGERLVELDRESRPDAAGGAEYRWRYLYLLADAGTGRLSASLPVFDPADGDYRVLRAGAQTAEAASPGRALLAPAALLLAAALLGGLYARGRRPRSVDACLQRLLGRSAASLSRAEILATLDGRLDPTTRSLLVDWWQRRDAAGYAPGPLPGPGSDPSPELCRRLRKVIDKRGAIP